MVLEKRIREILLDNYISQQARHKEWTVSPFNFEHDKRKQGRVMRELVQAGYLWQSGETYKVSGKVFDELQSEPLDLWEEWQKQNERRVKKLPFVQWDFLTHGQRKLVLLTAENYEFFLVHENIVRYQQNGNERDIVGPFLFKDYEEVHDKACADKTEHDKNRFPVFEICITNKKLSAAIQEHDAAMQFAELKVRNLSWGLEKVGLLSEVEANHFGSSRQEPLLGSGWGNLGEDPEKWGSNLDEQANKLRDKILDYENKLSRMKLLQEKMKEFGGWEKFLEVYTAKLKEQLELKELDK